LVSSVDCDRAFDSGSGRPAQAGCVELFQQKVEVSVEDIDVTPVEQFGHKWNNAVLQGFGLGWGWTVRETAGRVWGGKPQRFGESIVEQISSVQPMLVNGLALSWIVSEYLFERSETGFVSPGDQHFGGFIDSGQLGVAQQGPQFRQPMRGDRIHELDLIDPDDLIIVVAVQEPEGLGSSGNHF